ncbi:trans-sulfuration enzyme family protein [Tautonia sociabilis]|uniref:Aminotransferase class I/II-fold pyridoxal phosphate-dependent enzyme n=1 Tax=Tautonia sociabilis TaxID=2080755 RepID=A0A432MIF6_9BACT|nr:aminotransferase class I/II-fold pyridoxal phosphate-dependent enzyme [Tautonia sociabilis]RUL87154.1 aminotransferase class I/II-fold pyridoxal phosphate-dependent enzyme [Tautonia sociabilis]
MDSPPPRPETTCARAAPPVRPSTAPLVPPPHLSVVYRFEGIDHVDDVYAGRDDGFVYARDGHPNAAALADRIAALEAADAAAVFASGMAATAAVLLAETNAGDHVAFAEQLYGKTISLIGRELSRFGVSSSGFDATRPESLADALRNGTRLVFVETLSNPLLRLPDLPRLADLARQAGAKLVVDHTFAPLLCRPIELGASYVVHSGTKLIGGHSDLTLGLVAGSKGDIARLSSVSSTFGLSGNPFESWLATRGLATLPLRSARAGETARDLAVRLSRSGRVRAVHYPGLPEHPDHDRARSLLSGGFGAMITVDLGDRARADAFIRGLRHVPFAPSLGDVATTLSHPSSTSHRGQDPELLDRLGITPGLVRLSIGLEDADDLWADFDRALAFVE